MKISDAFRTITVSLVPDVAEEYESISMIELGFGIPSMCLASSRSASAKVIDPSTRTVPDGLSFAIPKSQSDPRLSRNGPFLSSAPAFLDLCLCHGVRNCKGRHGVSLRRGASPRRSTAKTNQWIPAVSQVFDRRANLRCPYRCNDSEYFAAQREASSRHPHLYERTRIRGKSVSRRIKDTRGPCLSVELLGQLPSDATVG